MTVNPLTVTPTTPIKVVYEIMKDNNFRQLPVVWGGELVGIVTERDVREIKHTPLFSAGVTEIIMTEYPITVTPDTPAHRAAAMLNAYKFNALPVLDDNVLVGIITTSSFLSHIIPMLE